MSIQVSETSGPGTARKRKRPASEPVCPREFLKTWNVEAFQATRLLNHHNLESADEQEEHILEQISKMMSVPDETIRELAEVCGKSTLYTGDEPKRKDMLLDLTVPPKDLKLETVKFQVEQRRLRFENHSLNVAANRHMKYNVMDDYLTLLPDAVSTVSEEIHQVPVPDVVISIQVTKCFQQGQIPTRHREMETFMVLGSQPLSALRDKINCSADAIIPGDYSFRPDIDPNILDRTGDLYKSSFFFIEDVFYNDSRQSDNKDYSKTITKWAAGHMADSKFTTEGMDKKLFFDLKIKLGHHYLFMHQGNCEHSVLFTDIRLHNAEDAQDVRMYPIVAVTKLRNRSVCQGCTKFSSKWIVQDSPLIPTDPCFLCKMCFKSLLYKKNGEKAGNFKAYHCTEFYSRGLANM